MQKRSLQEQAHRGGHRNRRSCSAKNTGWRLRHQFEMAQITNPTWQEKVGTKIQIADLPPAPQSCWAAHCLATGSGECVAPLLAVFPPRRAPVLQGHGQAHVARRLELTRPRRDGAAFLALGPWTGALRTSNSKMTVVVAHTARPTTQKRRLRLHSQNRWLT